MAENEKMMKMQIKFLENKINQMEADATNEDFQRNYLVFSFFNKRFFFLFV